MRFTETQTFSRRTWRSGRPRQQRRAAGDTRRRDFRVTLAQQRLHLVEGFTVNEWGDRYRDDLRSRLQLLRLGALAELMLADIGAPGHDTVELADAPTPWRV